MSNSIATPWIASYWIKVAEEHGADLGAAPAHSKKKKVQLTDFLTYQTSAEDNTLWGVVSDKEFKVPVRFSQTALEGYQQRESKRLTENKNAIITVQQFRPFFARIPVGGKVRKMTDIKYLALEVNEIYVVGSGQEPQFGNPKTLECHNLIREWSEGLAKGGGAGNVLKTRKAEEKSCRSSVPPPVLVQRLLEPNSPAKAPHVARNLPDLDKQPPKSVAFDLLREYKRYFRHHNVLARPTPESLIKLNKRRERMHSLQARVTPHRATPQKPSRHPLDLSTSQPTLDSPLRQTTPPLGLPPKVMQTTPTPTEWGPSPPPQKAIISTPISPANNKTDSSADGAKSVGTNDIAMADFEQKKDVFGPVLISRAHRSATLSPIPFTQWQTPRSSPKKSVALPNRASPLPPSSPLPTQGSDAQFNQSQPSLASPHSSNSDAPGLCSQQEEGRVRSPQSEYSPSAQIHTSQTVSIHKLPPRKVPIPDWKTRRALDLSGSPQILVPNSDISGNASNSLSQSQILSQPRPVSQNESILPDPSHQDVFQLEAEDNSTNYNAAASSTDKASLIPVTNSQGACEGGRSSASDMSLSPPQSRNTSEPLADEGEHEISSKELRDTSIMHVPSSSEPLDEGTGLTRTEPVMAPALEIRETEGPLITGLLPQESIELGEANTQSIKIVTGEPQQDIPLPAVLYSQYPLRIARVTDDMAGAEIMFHSKLDLTPSESLERPSSMLEYSPGRETASPHTSKLKSSPLTQKTDHTVEDEVPLSPSFEAASVKTSPLFTHVTPEPPMHTSPAPHSIASYASSSKSRTGSVKSDPQHHDPKAWERPSFMLRAQTTKGKGKSKNEIAEVTAYDLSSTPAPLIDLTQKVREGMAHSRSSSRQIFAKVPRTSNTRRDPPTDKNGENTSRKSTCSPASPSPYLGTSRAKRARDSVEPSLANSPKRRRANSNPLTSAASREPSLKSVRKLGGFAVSFEGMPFDEHDITPWLGWQDVADILLTTGRYRNRRG